MDGLSPGAKKDTELALMRRAELELARLADNSEIGARTVQAMIRRPDHHVLLVTEADNEQVAVEFDIVVLKESHDFEKAGERGFHITGATTMNAAIFDDRFERPLVSIHTNGVHVAGKHEARSGPPALQPSPDVGPPFCDFAAAGLEAEIVEATLKIVGKLLLTMTGLRRATERIDAGDRDHIRKVFDQPVRGRRCRCHWGFFCSSLMLSTAIMTSRLRQRI